MFWNHGTWASSYENPEQGHVVNSRYSESERTEGQRALLTVLLTIINRSYRTLFHLSPIIIFYFTIFSIWLHPFFTMTFALRPPMQKYAALVHLGPNPICLELTGKAEVGTWWS